MRPGAQAPGQGHDPPPPLVVRPHETGKLEMIPPMRRRLDYLPAWCAAMAWSIFGGPWWLVLAVVLWGMALDAHIEEDRP